MLLSKQIQLEDMKDVSGVSNTEMPVSGAVVPSGVSNIETPVSGVGVVAGVGGGPKIAWSAADKLSRT